MWGCVGVLYIFCRWISCKPLITIYNLLPIYNKSYTEHIPRLSWLQINDLYPLLKHCLVKVLLSNLRYQLRR